MISEGRSQERAQLKLDQHCVDGIVKLFLLPVLCLVKRVFSLPPFLPLCFFIFHGEYLPKESNMCLIVPILRYQWIEPFPFGITLEKLAPCTRCMPCCINYECGVEREYVRAREHTIWRSLIWEH